MIYLTVQGVVMFTEPYGFMSLDSFREMFGEEEYTKLLGQPRVISEYDDCERCNKGEH